MKLKNEVIEMIRKNNRVKGRMCYELNVSVPTIYRWIVLNENDGALTKQKVLQIISEELDMDASAILDENRDVKRSRFIRFI